MRALILSDQDVQRLLDAIDRDPDHGTTGGSSVVLNDVERQAHKEAHRFYNFQVRRWIDSVQK